VTQLAPGQTGSMTAGGLSCPVDRVGFAEVTAADVFDPDSTPNNYASGFIGAAVEDDEVFFMLPACCSP
jgi:hypothetical protein